MNIYEKQRVHEICESVKDSYLLGLLEESEVSEVEVLKTKKFLNETTSRIERMLIEEGLYDLGKSVIEEAFKMPGAEAAQKMVQGAAQKIHGAGKAAQRMGMAAGRKLDAAATGARNLGASGFNAAGTVSGKMMQNQGALANGVAGAGLAGAGALGIAGAGAAYDAAYREMDPAGYAADQIADAAEPYVNAAGQVVDQAGNVLGQAADTVADKALDMAGM